MKIKKAVSFLFAVSLLVIASAALICFTFTACSEPEPELPALTGTVSISGVAEVGQTLTANTDSLGGSGTISYQWKRGTNNIGTNSSTYVVQSADVDSTITVTVTRAGYTGSVTSAPTTAITDPSHPPLTGTVSISGVAVEGQTLTANTDSLGGNGTISYQWKRGTVDIGTNSNTYVLVNADDGATITVTVTRSGYSGSVTSEPVGPIGLPPLTGTVIISGVAVEGQTLTANTDSLDGSGTISYQWKRGTTNIGTNSSAYILVKADDGATITVTVTRSGYSGSVTSPAIGPIITIIPITFSSVTANGSSTQTTTQLTLTFSQAITGLTADDITLSGVSGVQKETLSGSGPTYTLPISGFTTSGTLNVAAAKSGYTISGSSKTVSIYYYTPPTVGIVINLAGIDEWQLTEQTAQATSNTIKSFTVTGTYTTYHWYLDGLSVGTSSSYTFYQSAGVYQLVVVVTNNSGESRSGRCRITVDN